MFKICSKCHIEKLESEFTKNKASKSGLGSHCRKCHQNYQYRYKEKRKITTALWQKNNKNYRNLYKKKWSKNNSDKIKKYVQKDKPKAKLRQQNRIKIDTNFRLSRNLRRRLHHALKKQSKSGSAVRDLGCTIPELKQYLESKFQPGMTWENYGIKGWHIDHIKPISMFDLTNKKQFLEANHYTNLQPLWAKDNIKKRNKYG